VAAAQEEYQQQQQEQATAPLIHSSQHEENNQHKNNDLKMRTTISSSTTTSLLLSTIVEPCPLSRCSSSVDCSSYTTAACSSSSEEPDDDDDETSSVSSRCEKMNDRQRTAHQQSINSRLRQRTFQLLVGVLGVYAAYLSYGLVQEQLYRFRDARTGSSFGYVWCLQVLESTASIGLGVVGRYFCGGRKDLPLRPFVLSGVSQVLAKVFCSLSLAAGLSFPVLTLSKAAKIVPVMLGQLLLGGSTYGIRDYLFAGLLVSGTVLLSLGSSKNANHSSHDDRNSTMGIAFVLLSLVMDGCTGGLQKQLKRDMAATPPTTYDFLLYTHISMLTTAFVVSVITGDLWHGLVYIQQQPAVAVLVTQLCLLSVVGQSFIFYLISNFDPMLCATVTTTRKMWSVLLSIFLFQHQLSTMGYSGLVLALAGLGVELQSKVFGKGGRPQQQPVRNLRKSSSLDEDELLGGELA